MEYEIEGNPDYGHLKVTLGPGEAFIAEAGAMAWMSEGTKVKARLLGGLFKAIVRKVFGGESLFVGEYRHEGGGSVVFSPSRPGTVLEKTLSGDTIILTAGSFMACSPEVTLKTRFGGLKGLFSGEGAFFIECGGTGHVFFNAYGAVVEREVEGSLTVDTGHMVAWDPGLTYTIRGMGNLKSTLLSGEGLVMSFSGRGKVYLQTRTMGGVSKWLAPIAGE
jgi:uncharacterized protein (TIGR00266 family)